MQSDLRRIGILFVLVTLFAPVPRAFAMDVAAQSQVDQTIIARVTIKTRPELERFVTLGLDLLEMREGDDLFILTTQAQIEWLRGQGWTVSVDEKRTAAFIKRSQPEAKIYRGGYRTVAEMRAFLDGKAALYPNLTEVFIYGSSWEKVSSGGTAGHELFGIRLTNKQRPGPKPRFFLMAAIHARELVTSELALRFVDYLLSGYGVNGNATWLLDEHEIIVVPVANPDGRVIAEQGYLQRKNTNNTYGGNCQNPPTGFDQIGVDLNRNSSFKWGIVNTPNEPKCGQTYPGPSPASEPETTALENLIRSLFPDQRGPLDTNAAPTTTTGIMITLHSYGNLVLWPWGHKDEPAPNGADLALIGGKLAYYNGYTAHHSIGLYPTSGTTDDWSYGELGIPSFTFEVGSGDQDECGGFNPPFVCVDTLWPLNQLAFTYAATIARAPYQLAHGPTTEYLAATVTSADHVQLEAGLSDQWNGGQVITAAEYYIDTPPWRGGTPFPMGSQDGSFDSQNEVATVSVGPLHGRHQFYVRARDGNGNWGPVRSAFATTASAPATLQIGAGSYSFSEGAGRASVTITRSGDASARVSVSYSSRDTAGLNNCNVINGIASSRCDYTMAVGNVVFVAGDTAAKTISIPLVDDAYAEGQESFTLSLNAPSGASLGAVSSTIININDNEASNGPNPIDQTIFFVRQHYIDFLGREPDSLSVGWVNQINNCVPLRPECDRLSVSQGIYLSPEFRDRGYFIYKFYAVALGRKPSYTEFVLDRARVSGFQSNTQLEQSKQDFIADFVTRPSFRTIYDSQTTARSYVETMLARGGLLLPVATRENIISRLGGGVITRAQALREIAESGEANARYINEATIVMHYFGYLRRDPDSFYQDWINILTSTGDSRNVTNGFVNSAEYRMRFGQ